MAAIEFVRARSAARAARDPAKQAGESRLAAVADYCQTVFSLNEFMFID
jgi:hypothetical protein